MTLSIENVIPSLTPQILLKAYASGVFPMSESAEDTDIFWVCPKRRGIIPLDKFHESRTLLKTIKIKNFDIRINYNFQGIIEGCAEAKENRASTWINDLIRKTYGDLFKSGYCHTVEAWKENKLCGGLYGVTLGRAFFGESMFSRERDSSKVCLSFLVKRLRERGFELLDIQFITDHLKQFGAIEITRKRYEKLLSKALTGIPADFIN